MAAGSNLNGFGWAATGSMPAIPASTTATILPICAPTTVSARGWSFTAASATCSTSGMPKRPMAPALRRPTLPVCRVPWFLGCRRSGESRGETVMNVLQRVGWDRAAGLLLVVALHAAVLYGLWAARVIPPPSAAMTLFVNLIEPAPIPPKPSVAPPPRPARPLKREMPPPPEPHRHLAANTPVVSPADAVEPAPPPPAVIEAPPAPVEPPPAPPARAEPVALGSELALTCPERSPPAYPPDRKSVV